MVAVFKTWKIEKQWIYPLFLPSQSDYRNEQIWRKSSKQENVKAEDNVRTKPHAVQLESWSSSRGLQQRGVVPRNKGGAVCVVLSVKALNAGSLYCTKAQIKIWWSSVIWNIRIALCLMYYITVCQSHMHLFFFLLMCILKFKDVLQDGMQWLMSSFGGIETGRWLVNPKERERSWINWGVD